MSKAVDVKVTTLTSRKKSEASETAAAEILERIDGVLEGDDFPALATLPHSSRLGLGQVVPTVWVRHLVRPSSVFAGSDSPGPHQAYKKCVILMHVACLCRALATRSRQLSVGVWGKARVY